MMTDGELKTRGLSLLPLILVLLLLGSVWGFEALHANRIYPGVSVWGIHVGGLPPDAAAAMLEADFRLDAPLISLLGPDGSRRVRPSDLGLRLQAGPTLEQAFELGRGLPWSASLLAQLELLILGVDIPPVLTFEESITRHYLETVAEEIHVAPVDAQLVFEGTRPLVVPAQPGSELDVEATLTLLSPAVAGLSAAEIPLILLQITPLVTDAEAARAEAEKLLSRPLTLVLTDPREGDPGPWVIQPEKLVEMMEVQVEEGVIRTGLDEVAMRAYLEKLGPALTIDPVNARFRFEDATQQLEPIAESAEGRRLDVEGSAHHIAASLAEGKHEVALLVEKVPPPYPDSATAHELGIVDLVAEGESYFIGSPSGRDHNIRLAATMFDGLVISPGETFSFNRYLGEVTAEAGYDESYITAGEQLEMGIGGGICQVSTTAFRAAFWGGYPITERWYHGQRVGYYELRGGGVGMDATVFSPHVDMKFVNDRSAPLLIETEVGEETHRLVFSFFSTDDGRRVEQLEPIVTEETAPGPPIYELDEDLAPGTVTKWQSPVGGLTATVERRVYDKSGDILYHDTFVSKYEPRRAAYHYGPGYQPPTNHTES